LYGWPQEWRIIVGLPVCVTDDADAACARAARAFDARQTRRRTLQFLAEQAQV